MSVIIRDLVATDREAWLTLWAGYLAFYRQDLPAAVTNDTWARLMDPTAPHKTRVAQDATGLLGFATHMHHASTWAIADRCYLEDLFVVETARGKGVGRALIEDLKLLAASRGWQRVYWHTNENNATARALYDSFAPADGFVRYTIPLDS